MVISTDSENVMEVLNIHEFERDTVSALHCVFVATSGAKVAVTSKKGQI